MFLKIYKRALASLAAVILLLSSIVVPVQRAHAASLVEYGLLVNLIASIATSLANRAGIPDNIKVTGIACDLLSDVNSGEKRVQCIDGNDRAKDFAGNTHFNPMLDIFQKNAQDALLSCDSAMRMSDSIRAISTDVSARANLVRDYMRNTCAPDSMSDACKKAIAEYLSTSFLAAKYSRFSLAYRFAAIGKCI